LLDNGSSESPEEVAMCSLVTFDLPNLYLNSFCFGFRPKAAASFNGLFLTYLMRSGSGREMVKSLAQGSTRYNLSKGAMLNTLLRLPSEEEQTAIAQVLSDMDAELAALETRREKTRQLKQGMMQVLLTGRTRLV
jgi:type I restriction enzyme S subunit